MTRRIRRAWAALLGRDPLALNRRPGSSLTVYDNRSPVPPVVFGSGRYFAVLTPEGDLLVEIR